MGTDVYRHRCQFQSFSERNYFLGGTDINNEACRPEGQLIFCDPVFSQFPL